MEDIVRRLEDGWHFRPDWRRRIVDCHLSTTDPAAEPAAAIQHEEDSHIRQYYLFRCTGCCANRPAFAWAHLCYSKNRQTGGASLIRAMTIARASAAEIAVKLRTTPKNVKVFQKLFWDVEAYLDERDWLASIVFEDSEATDLASRRERHWLTAAFLKGKEGLAMVLSRKVAMTPDERDELTAQIRCALTARAHEFVTSQQNGFAPAGPEDLDRLVRMLDAAARQPATDDKAGLMNAFIQGIHSTLMAQAESPEHADDPVLAAYRELAKEETESTAAPGATPTSDPADAPQAAPS